MARHNVFVSYHHEGNKFGYSKADSVYREEFERLCASQMGVMVSKSVQDGDIPSYSSPDNTHRIIRDKYLRDSTVTVVLIGNDTWRRKHVDWEIASSLRQTLFSSRSGVIGIILPTFDGKQYYSYPTSSYAKLENDLFMSVRKTDIPERLALNLENGFVKIYDWSNDPYEIQKWIHDAFLRRDKIIPDNSLLMFQRNK